MAGSARQSAADEPEGRLRPATGATKAVLAGRCRTLGRDRNLIAADTGLHQRPNPGAPKRPADQLAA